MDYIQQIHSSKANLKTRSKIKLPDGRVVPFNDSPEHFKLLAEQMGRPDPVESSPEAEASFLAALKDMNRLYSTALRKPHP